MPVANQVDRRMVFLVGARRSGTNWLHRMLGAHPEILRLPSETYLFDLGLAPLAALFHEGSPGSHATASIFMPEAELHAALRTFCDRVFLGLAERLHPGARVLVERTPWHARRLDLIRAIYPDAAVVHIVRDPRDAVSSLVRQSYGPATVEEAIEEWISCVAAAQEAAPRWGEHYREVRYEDLLADPDAAMASLFAWLGLETPPAVAEQVRLEAGVGFNVDTVDPRITAAKWRGVLSVEEQRLIEARTDAQLDRLGYPRGATAPMGGPAPRRTRWPRTPSRRGTVAPASPAARTPPATERNQRRRDALLTALNRGRPDEVVALLSPAAEVTVVAADGQWSARGEAAAARLRSELEAHRVRPEHGDRLVRADVHAHGSALVAVLTHAGVDGTRRDSAVIAEGDDGGITSMTYYRFPLPA